MPIIVHNNYGTVTERIETLIISDKTIIADSPIRTRPESVRPNASASPDDKAPKATDNTQQSQDIPFILVRDNAEDIINLLRKYMSGIARNKPKDMMMPVRAAFDAGVIRKPTYSEFKEAFPRFAPKNKSSFTDYLVTDGITPNPYEKVPGYEEIVKAFKALVGN